MKNSKIGHPLIVLLLILFSAPSLYAVPITYTLETAVPTTVHGATFTGEAVWDDAETVLDLSTAISWEFHYTPLPDSAGFFDTPITYSSSEWNDVFGSYGALLVDSITGDLVPEGEMRWQISNNSQIFMRFMSITQYDVQYTSINLYAPFEDPDQSTFISATEPEMAFRFVANDSDGSPPTGSTQPVPEPATMLLLGTGIIGLVCSRFRNKGK